MSNEPYERGLDIFRDGEADEDFRTESGVLSPDPTTGTGTGTANYPDTGGGQRGLDDSQPTPVTSDQTPERAALGSEGDDDLTGSSYDPADNPAASPANLGGVAGSGTASASAGSGPGVKEAAGHAVEKAGDVAGSAAEKAGELKDVALDRGGDVAAVAKDELARLAHEARAEVQSLWSNASEQVRVQAATGQQQLSELLHSLAGELGEMASKSENNGPLTALAKQAAAKGGEWSHWLANSEPTDVLTQVRRFARRRPFVFLASAAVAGVVVGRLGRGLMAANDSDSVHPARAELSDAGSVPATTGVTTPPVVSYEEVPSFGTGEAPDQHGAYASPATADNPYGVNGGTR
ncbi:MAG TPA: hypothetical protein VGK17_11680 [Propionicimonas sp.]|jgi:hypothetical protein